MTSTEKRDFGYFIFWVTILSVVTGNMIAWCMWDSLSSLRKWLSESKNYTCF